MKSSFDGVDPVLCPRDSNTGEALPPRRQPGYYPGFSTISQSPFWDDATRAVVDDRVRHPPERKFFSAEAWSFWTTVFAHLIPQTDRTADRQIPIVAVLDHRLATNQTVGYRYDSMPQDRVVYEIGIEGIDREAEHRYKGKFLVLPYFEQDLVLKAIHDGKPEAASEIWKRMSVHRFWQMIMGDAIDAYYAHPWAWDEVGFGGPAYPRAYTRLERGEPEPWEVEEQRYDWLPPANTASAEVDSSYSHHTESGQHSLLAHRSKGAKR
jgi:hypothetical protein